MVRKNKSNKTSEKQPCCRKYEIIEGVQMWKLPRFAQFCYGLFPNDDYCSIDTRRFRRKNSKKAREDLENLLTQENLPLDFLKIVRNEYKFDNLISKRDLTESQYHTCEIIANLISSNNYPEANTWQAYLSLDHSDDF